CRAASMDHAMSGLPKKSTTFLRGIRLDPPRAGMMAMRCSTTGTAPENEGNPWTRSVLGLAGFDEGNHFFVEGDRRPDGFGPYAVDEILQGSLEGGEGVPEDLVLPAMRADHAYGDGGGRLDARRNESRNDAGAPPCRQCRALGRAEAAF